MGKMEIVIVSALMASAIGLELFTIVGLIYQCQKFGEKILKYRRSKYSRLQKRSQIFSKRSLM